MQSQGIHRAAGPQAAPETSAQIAAHRRIARAHDQRLRTKFFSMRSQRLSELMDFVRYQFGATLPDDDYGRDVLREILNQIALTGAGPDVLRDRGRDLLPEIDDDDSLDIMVQEIGTGRRIKAEALGRAIGLTYKARVALDITTIGAADISPARRKEITAQKRAADKRWNREKAGAKPHARSERQAKPWIALGISERTYRNRKKAAAEMVQADLVAAFRPDHDEVIPGAAVDAANSPSAREVAEAAPAVEAFPHIETERAASEAVSGKASPPAPASDTARADSLKGAGRWEDDDGPAPNSTTAEAESLKLSGNPENLSPTDTEQAARLEYRRRRERWELKQRDRAAIIAGRKREGIEIGAGEKILLDRIEKERQARFEAGRRRLDAERQANPAYQRTMARRHATLVEAVAQGLLPASVLEGRAA